MATDDGGNAFPALEKVQQYDDDRGTYVDSYQPMGGMRLRDYFAAKALQGFMSAAAHPQSVGITELDAPKLSRDAYKLADAMIAERLK